MSLDIFIERFREFAADTAVVWRDEGYTYGDILARFESSTAFIIQNKIAPGAVVALEADFSPDSVALLLALIAHGAIIVPLTKSVKSKREEFLEVAQVETCLSQREDGAFEALRIGDGATHELYAKLRGNSHPGLVLFSSGSTGKSKGAVHDFIPLLKKFEVQRAKQITISFLLFDHIGGINTLLYTLSNGGCLVTVEDRSPDTVLAAVAKWKVELLPTSPTFINLMLVSEAYKRHSLESLKTVTYGTEPMPEATLKKWSELFPSMKLLQTYGLSEIGIMRSKSKSSDSLWVKIGGEDFDTRVVDGILHVKAKSAMLGYLNAPSPFSEDGWFITGDEVRQDGDYFLILGRKSEIINVGGEKVYPAEIESVIHELDSVSQVTVYGEKNPITGQVVCAHVTPKNACDEKALVKEIRTLCSSRLPRYKVPVKVFVSTEQQHTERFKRDRARISTKATEA